MDIRDHAAHSKELFNLSAEDIHKWIDGYFDNQGFQSFLQGEPSPRFNPYAHRRHRHCRETLEEALEEFKHLYTPRQIEQIFFQHLKDDYDDYIPSREDFDRDDFLQKYHHNPRQETVRQEPILSSEERERYFIYNSDTANKKSGNSGFLLRIVLPSLISAGLFLIFIFYFIVPSIEEVMINGKREMIRELSNAAASVIDYYIELEQQGVMTLEEAQRETLSELEKMRYGIMGKDYYWIIDHQPVMIMHTYRPELVGQDLSNYRDREDKSGKFLFQEAVKLVEAQGEGYIRYQWQWMDDPDSSAEKMSYVMSIEYWGWILGTGVYIHDVQLELEEIQGRLIRLSLLLSGGILLLLLVMVFQSRKIENSRRKAEQGLVEAKERYRSLVERSNEAYLLILDNKIVFANQRMLQMLDAREEEIGRSTLEELMERIKPEEERMTLLKLIKEGKEPGKERSLRLSSKKGSTLLVTLHLSRVFFQDSNGYLMSIKEIPPFQAVELKPQVVFPGISVETLIEEIRGSATHNYAILRLQTLSGILLQVLHC